ncbi:hypothetical protein DFH06DRAFT_709899 [Mycena polygramma]|nr:hypothetical protein DFH06DRAFT_709899 [Mycena polygramma]
MLRLWLERSRPYPLHLRLGKHEWASDELVDAFASHRARCECLELRREKVDLDMFRGPMPLLRRLKLVVDHAPDERFSLHEVPSLRSVTLSRRAAMEVILPWAQLTSLTLITIQPYECTLVLLQTPNLIHCELHIYHLAFSAEPQDIPLPCLETLVFIDACGRIVIDFLPTFITPTLRSLKVPEHFLAPNPIDTMTAFVAKSDCRLEELDITAARSVPENSYRQVFPSLRTFSMAS